VLRAIKRVIDCSHEAGKWTGMCGEMAGDERAALILAGLGLDEFSMSATSIPRIKKVLREENFVTLQQLAQEAVNQATTEDVKAVLDAHIG
jgi:phosphotransferase system enzyme I (PtsI)